jgi:hypothetical protein
MRCFLFILASLLIVTATSKTKVAVIGFQRNEVIMLEFWLAYHVALFGAKNVAILDNNTVDPESLKILKKWAKKGVIVAYKQGPYSMKGILTGTAFKKFFPKHNIAIPLDIDEVLVSYRNDAPMVNRDAIHADLERFWKSKAPCGAFKQYYNNQLLSSTDTLQTTEYFLPGPVYGDDVAKKFARLSMIKGFDHGNHNVFLWPPNKRGPELNWRNCSYEMNHLGLLHYVQSEPILKLRKAILDCIGFGHFPPNMTAENFRSFGNIIEAKRHVKGVSGVHKLERVIHVYDHGLKDLYSKPHTNLLRVGNFEEMVEAVTDHSNSDSSASSWWPW